MEPSSLYVNLFQEIYDYLNIPVNILQKLDIYSAILEADSDWKRVAAVAPLLKVINFKPTSNLHPKSEINARALQESGDIAFVKRKDFQALRLYTESISISPNGSAELALAYANRSAILKAMGHLKEAIADIDRALQQGYPDVLRYRLISRQAACLQGLGKKEEAFNCATTAKHLIDCSDLPVEKKEELKLNINKEIKSIKSKIAKVDPCDDEWIELPHLSYGENKEAPSASDCIAIKYSKEWGRHLEATRDINPGDVVIVEEPYIDVLLPAFRFSHCSHCLMRCSALIPCPNCTWALFCSQDCLEESFYYHKFECPMMPFVLGLNDGVITLLTVRILAKQGIDGLVEFLRDPANSSADRWKQDPRLIGFTPEGQFLSSDFRSIYSFNSHTSERSMEELLARSLISCLLMECLQLTNHPDYNALAGFLFSITQILSLYSFGVREFILDAKASGNDKSISIGGAIYAVTCLANHSCDPNIHAYNQGSNMIMFAVEPIKKGSQVMCSYGPFFIFDKKMKRQLHLKRQYLFDCECEACLYSWHTKLPDIFPLNLKEGNKEELKELLIAYKPIYKACRKMKTLSQITENMIPLFANLLTVLHKQGRKPTKSYMFCQLVLKTYFAKLGNLYTL